MDTQKNEIERAKDIAAELAKLEKITVKELMAKYQEVFGEETRSRNKQYLIKKIAWRIQEIAEGGLSGKALKRIDELAENAPIRQRQHFGKNGNGKIKTIVIEKKTEQKIDTNRDNRLPAVGETISKIYKGKEYTVKMLEKGFDYNGLAYRSLSKIAKEITGTTWNGFLFFGLTKTKKEKEKAGA